MLRSVGIPNDLVRTIFTEYAKVQMGGANLAKPGTSDVLPTSGRTFKSLLDYATFYVSNTLREQIRPKMRVSAFEDTFMTVYESWTKKQARRSRINWKKRFMRLRAHGPTFVLSYYKTDGEDDCYIQQVPLAIGINVYGDKRHLQIEIALDQGGGDQPEKHVLLRFKVKSLPIWFEWLTHLRSVTMIMETESATSITSNLTGFKQGVGGGRRAAQSVWRRELTVQEQRQREAQAQNAALEKRIKDLERETGKGTGRRRNKDEMERLRQETMMLQKQRDLMTNEARKLKDEVYVLVIARHLSLSLRPRRATTRERRQRESHRRPRRTHITP